MIVKNNKIVRASDSELYHLYLEREMYEVMEFNEYKIRMENAGCRVIDDSSDEYKREQSTKRTSAIIENAKNILNERYFDTNMRIAALNEVSDALKEWNRRITDTLVKIGLSHTERTYARCPHCKCFLKRDDLYSQFLENKRKMRSVDVKRVVYVKDLITPSTVKTTAAVAKCKYCGKKIYAYNGESDPSPFSERVLGTVVKAKSKRKTVHKRTKSDIIVPS